MHMDITSAAMVSLTSSADVPDEARVLPFRRKKKPLGGLPWPLHPEPGDEPLLGSEKDLPDQIAGLAAKGLAEEEIRHLLANGLADHSLDDGRVAAAMERGRGMGRARIKVAQYEAALAGKVSAQSQVLARLENQAGHSEGGGREFEVVREIVPAREPEI